MPQVSKPTLKALGFSDTKEASRVQRVAALPERTFDAYVEDVKAAGDVPTMAGALKLARAESKQAKRNPEG